MNTAVTFDTHEFVRSLESAGMPTGQAEAISTAVRKAQANADVATKEDLRQLETRLEAKFDAKFDVLNAKFDQFRWVMGFMLAAILSLMVKTFF